MRNPYSKNEIEKLSGYDLMEVLNHGDLSTRQWDEALSAGKVPWIIADDDCHDISRPDETGISWTMVNAEAKNAPEVLNALLAGRAYGVNGRNGINDHYLKKVTVSGDTATFVTDSAATAIDLIGQNGAVKKMAANCDSLSYIFQPEDSYVRAEISFPKMKIYLNPLIRYDGRTVPHNYFTAGFDRSKTLADRMLVALIWIIGVAWLLFPGPLRVLWKRDRH